MGKMVVLFCVRLAVMASLSISSAESSDRQIGIIH